MSFKPKEAIKILDELIRDHHWTLLTEDDDEQDTKKMEAQINDLVVRYKRARDKNAWLMIHHLHLEALLREIMDGAGTKESWKEWRLVPAGGTVEETGEMYYRMRVALGDHECPHGGDITDDCADCPYAGEDDYHYDPNRGDCVRRH